MTPKDVVKFFGGQTAAAVALGTSRQVINNWVRRRRVTAQWQLVIADRSNKKLKARIEVIL